MTVLIVAVMLWVVALGWVAMRRIGPWVKQIAMSSRLRESVLPLVLMLFAALILVGVVAQHVSSGAGPDALLAMTGATFVLIAQVIARVRSEKNGS